MRDFITIDFETANSNNNSACSVGIAIVKDCEIIDTKHFLIQPPNNEFNPRNIKIHGITPNDTQNAPFFPIIWKKIAPFIKNSYIVAHNAQFDLSVLSCCLDEYNLSQPYYKYIENISLFSRAYERLYSNSLSNCADFLGIDIGNHHNALNDAIVCAKIAIKSIEKLKTKSFFEFIDSCQQIKIKESFELIANKEFLTNKTKDFSTIRVAISEITAIEEPINKLHPFYGKNFVFTGNLQSLDRKEAMQRVVNLGGILKSSVSKSIDYLVVGEQDKNIVGEDGMSTKEERAYELINQGISIKILNEKDFLDML